MNRQEARGIPMTEKQSLVRLGIDLGTGSLKMKAFCEDTSFSASQRYEILSPRAGIAETDPQAWIRALKSAWEDIRNQLEWARLSADVASIGLSGQMHGFVPVSKSGKALCNAILWADVRGAEYAESYSHLLGNSFDRLMNAPAAGLTALILMWLKNNEPELYVSTSRILFPKDYLRYRLTGILGTDAGDASASLLWDFKAHTWSEAVLSALNLDGSKLPPVLDSFALGGIVTEAASRETGLPAGVPVAVGSADKSCEIYGSGFFNDYFASAAAPVGESAFAASTTPATRAHTFSSDWALAGAAPSVREQSLDADWAHPGAALVSIGTGVQVVIPVRGIPPYSPSLNFFETCVRGVRYRMAAMLNGGLALEWVLAAFKGGWASFYHDLDEGRVSLPHDLIFLPYLTGERSPYQNSKARGAWIGLGLHHSNSDMLASALLGVACTIRLGMETLSIAPHATIYCVGGSTRHLTWMRIVSAMTGRRLLISPEPDASVRGAAAIGASARISKKAQPGFSSPAEMPTPLATSPIETAQADWMNEYYEKFKSYYAALFGAK